MTNLEWTLTALCVLLTAAIAHHAYGHRRRVSWDIDDDLPPVRPVQLAEQLMLKGGPPNRHPERPIDQLASVEAALSAPASTRFVLDFGEDGYILRGSRDNKPGEWIPPKSVGSLELLIPPLPGQP